jgi:hypothetical protein
MSKKKSIDRLFQESLKDIKVQPPAGLWDAIENRLDHKKKKNVIPLWWALAVVAAGLAILATGMYLNSTDNINLTTPDKNTEIVNETETKSQESLENSKNKNTGKIATPENQSAEHQQFAIDNSKSETKPTRKNDPNRPSETETETKKTNAIKNSVIARQQKQAVVLLNNQLAMSGSKTNPKASKTTNAPIAENKQEQELKKPAIDKQSPNYNKQKDTTVATLIAWHKVLKNDDGANDEQPKGKNLENTILDDTAINNVLATKDSIIKKQPLLQDMATLEDIEKQKEEVNTTTFERKWAATTQVGPVYARSMGGSAVNNEVSEHQGGTQGNLSYGIGVSYQVAPRWTVRTGVNQLQMVYNTQDINYQMDFNSNITGSFAQDFTANAVKNASPLNNNFVNNNTLGSDFAAQELLSNQFTGIKGALSQQLAYIEVPLEVQYSLLNSRFKIQVSGGISALFLTENTVGVENNNLRLELGEDRNFNNFNQSANFGLGLGYDINTKLGAFIEPSFKYQLNTLRDNTANFRPYIIGIHSGVRYRF